MSTVSSTNFRSKACTNSAPEAAVNSCLNNLNRFRGHVHGRLLLYYNLKLKLYYILKFFITKIFIKLKLAVTLITAIIWTANFYKFLKIQIEIFQFPFIQDKPQH